MPVQTRAQLGQEVSDQLLSNPRVLGIGSNLLGFLGIMPGLPKFNFLFLSVILEVEQKAIDSKIAAAISSLLSVDPLELKIGYNLIPLVDTNIQGDLLNQITLIRRQIAIDLNLVIPPRIRDNIQLHPSTYE